MRWENLIKIKLSLSAVADNIRPYCFCEEIVTHTYTQTHICIHPNFAAGLDLITAWIIKGRDRNPLACWFLLTDHLSAVLVYTCLHPVYQTGILAALPLGATTDWKEKQAGSQWHHPLVLKVCSQGWFHAHWRHLGLPLFHWNIAFWMCGSHWRGGQ